MLILCLALTPCFNLADDGGKRPSRWAASAAKALGFYQENSGSEGENPLQEATDPIETANETSSGHNSDASDAELSDEPGPQPNAAVTPGTSTSAPGPPTPVVIMPFDTAHEADNDDVYTRSDKVKVNYDMKDPIYWIRRLEIRMQAANIKSQWWKRITFETNLPPDIGHKLKDLFC